MNKHQREKIKGYRILSIDASDVYERVKSGNPIEISNSEGQIDFEKFTAVIYNSLETKKLEEEFNKEKKNRNVIGSFELDKPDKQDKSEYSATLTLINITFKKNYKHISKEKLRKILYENGIKIKSLRARGKGAKKEFKPTVTKYVRYKRSAGSSREGNCLFIIEPLKKRMMRWSLCGMEENVIKDKVSLESYVSLTLSNSKTEISIKNNEILIIPDAVSTSDQTALKISLDDNGTIISDKCDVRCDNKIWDGQALLDESVFDSNETLRGKGMALLRNRFFKTCAFNTRLQAWFKDNGITSVSQLTKLNPEYVTSAKRIEDIKLVTTDSSIKSIKLKLSALSDEATCDEETKNCAIKSAKLHWLAQVDSNDNLFGVVKTDKPTSFFNGRLVQTSYQLINTLDLNAEELEQLILPAKEYLIKILNDPIYMRYYLKSATNAGDNDEYDYYNGEEYDEDEEVEFQTLRKKVNYDLLARNDDYSKTKFYSYFRDEIRKNYLCKLKKGKLLVSGTNATLFGNGYEMLLTLNGEKYDFYSPRAEYLEKNEVRITKFGDGEELLCSRSPHVTMGNLFIAKNKISENDVYSRYFNLTPEIICVNSIGESLLDRLNGSDFDSDFVLATNNSTMIDAAKRHYNKFLVPIGKFEDKGKDSELYKIDNDIAENDIGRIINTSQWLNSLFWDRKSRGRWDENLYHDICKLAVLSGLEIDKAKRDYGIDAAEQLKTIKEKYFDKDAKRPQFMELLRKIDKRKCNALKDVISYTDSYHTSMQTLQSIAKVANADRNNDYRELKSFLCGIESNKKLTNEYRDREKIVLKLYEENEKLKGCYKKLRVCDDSEVNMIWERIKNIEYECVTFVKKKMKSDEIMYLLIAALDKALSTNSEEENEGLTQKVKDCQSFLLSAVCSANDNYYMQVKEKATKERKELIMDEDGDISIFGVRHKISVSE